MAEFKSKETKIETSVEKLYATLSDFENLRTFLDKIPENQLPADKAEALKNVEITADAIAFKGGPTGAVKLVVAEKKEPTLIKLKAADVPIDLFLSIAMTAVDENSCNYVVKIEANIPAMMKPMVAGPLQKVVDQFAAVLANISF